jgi:hypothetical protein
VAPGDLQRLAEERLRLLDRVGIPVEENLGPQAVELSVVEVRTLLLGVCSPYAAPLNFATGTRFSTVIFRQCFRMRSISLSVAALK